MIYCKLISENGKYARYSIGGRTNDLTGVLFIDAVNETYTIEKQPSSSQIYERLVNTMVNRYMKDFKKGLFKERISHEIG